MKSMALAPLLLLTLILSAAAVLEAAVDADPPTGAAPPTGAVSTFCEPRCAVRCSKAGRPNRCLTYCNICCAKCHCVPSGTYGNRDECPCYRDLKNSKGGPKCP